MEAVIGDTQQDSCLLSPKEEKREVRGYGRIWTMERERGKIKGR